MDADELTASVEQWIHDGELDEARARLSAMLQDTGSLLTSSTSRIARSRNSSGYFLGAAMTLILRGLRASMEAGAVHSAPASRRPELEAARRPSFILRVTVSGACTAPWCWSQDLVHDPVMSPDEFPPITVVDVDDERSARWSGMREVTPLLSRHPEREWRFFFTEAARRSPVFKWLDAGFVRCGPAEVPGVEAGLRACAAEANEKFVEFLTRAAVNQPDEVAQLLELMAIAAASGEGRVRLVSWV